MNPLFKSCHEPVMALLRLAMAFLIAIAPNGVSHADVAPGAEPKEWPADPGKHTVTILRESKDAKQAAMITAAENAQPSKKALQQAVGEGVLPVGEKVWWYKEALGIRIPYAITADAVSYYADLVGNYSKQRLKRYVQPTSRFEYHASVDFQKEYVREGKTFRDAHIVTMKLTFSQNFTATQTEGMQFEKERTVVLDGEGKVLEIFGDGPTEVPILAI
jgi:hypothetical protein